MRAPAAVAFLVVWVLGGCGDATPSGRLLVDGADSPTALAALPDGGLRYGERLTGRIGDDEIRVLDDPLS